MKKPLFLWQMGGFFFTGVMGVLLHFLFDWSGENILIAPFSAVNESIWEHLKLLFFPMFAFALIENRLIGKTEQSFWCVKMVGIILGLFLIPMLYYGLNGAFGSMPDGVNIGIFFFAAAVAYWSETKILKESILVCQSPEKVRRVLWLLALAFVVLTFVPPHVPLFEDPMSKTYGYWKQF